MNAEQLVEDVARIVQDPSYDDELILKFLNRGQLYIASKVLMPGLGNGKAIVSTVAVGTEVLLPTNFHRELYSASVDSVGITICNNLAQMIRLCGEDLEQSGDVYACTISGRTLVYIDTPTTPVNITLLYYRKPIAMTLSSLSFPDGMTSDSDTYDSALISYSAWMIYQEIEQGLEGKKIDTSYHKSKLDLHLEELLSAPSEGRPRRKASVCAGSWP